jgi:hypothetical protein
MYFYMIRALWIPEFFSIFDRHPSPQGEVFLARSVLACVLNLHDCPVGCSQKKKIKMRKKKIPEER